MKFTYDSLCPKQLVGSLGFVNNVIERFYIFKIIFIKISLLLCQCIRVDRVAGTCGQSRSRQRNIKTWSQQTGTKNVGSLYFSLFPCTNLIAQGNKKNQVCARIYSMHSGCHQFPHCWVWLYLESYTLILWYSIRPLEPYDTLSKQLNLLTCDKMNKLRLLKFKWTSL